MSARTRKPRSSGNLVDRIQAGLKKAGLDVDVSGQSMVCCGDGDDGGVKVICVAPGMGESVRALSRTSRGQVAMVRVDDDTSRQLDAWVETGAVKSRSEAAALFIREGLAVRAAELAKLAKAVEDVEQARSRLRKQARSMLGDDPATD